MCTGMQDQELVMHHIGAVVAVTLAAAVIPAESCWLVAAPSCLKFVQMPFRPPQLLFDTNFQKQRLRHGAVCPLTLHSVKSISDA